MQRIVLTIDVYTVEIFYNEENTITQIDEAKHRGIHIGGPYSAKYHKAHTNPGKDHLLFYNRQNKLFAMNVDGTGHDGSSGTKIPNRIVKGVKQTFPNVKIPDDNIVENMKLPDELLFLLDK